jgi:general secretion pathway protein I
MATPRKRRSESGTTLLEVLVAVAIASIALVSFISLVIGSMDLEDTARKVTDATLAADAKLNEVEQAGYPETGTTEGLINEQDPNGFSYRLVVSDGPIEGLRRVDVEVFWDKKRRSVPLTTYIAKQ